MMGTQQLPSVLDTESKKWIAIDQVYHTLPFVLRAISEQDKLQGHKNFKSWLKMIELDLGALNLVPFIRSEHGEEITVSLARRSVLNAQALQYIRAIVSKHIANLLDNVTSAFEARTILEKTYRQSKMHKLVDLYQKFERLKFQPGFDPIRYVTEFENCIAEY